MATLRIEEKMYCVHQLLTIESTRPNIGQKPTQDHPDLTIGPMLIQVVDRKFCY